VWQLCRMRYPFSRNQVEFFFHSRGGIYDFYRTSYIWYSLIGCMLTISVGLAYSAITSKSLKGNSRKLNPDFVSPVISKLFDVGSEFDSDDKREFTAE